MRELCHLCPLYTCQNREYFLLYPPSRRKALKHLHTALCAEPNSHSMQRCDIWAIYVHLSVCGFPQSPLRQLGARYSCNREFFAFACDITYVYWTSQRIMELCAFWPCRDLRWRKHGRMGTECTSNELFADSQRDLWLKGWGFQQSIMQN